MSPFDDETRSHRIVERTTAWPAAVQPTARLAAPPPASTPTGRDDPVAGRRLRIAGMALAAGAAIAAAVLVGTHYSEPTRHDLGGVGTRTPNAKHPPQLDVALDECRIERDGAHVTGTARNPMDETARFTIEVHLVDDANATITSAAIDTAPVAPDTRDPWSGVLPPVASTAQHATCRLVNVDRFTVQ